MKWKHESPKLGDRRIEERMAWIPTKLDDGYTVWLETYRVHLRYESRQVMTKFTTSVPRERWFEIGTESLRNTL